MKTLQSFLRQLRLRTIKRPILSMTLVIIAFAGIQALFSFCGRKSCPAFLDLKFDAWFPYQNSGDLYFTDGISTDTLAQRWAQRSEAYEASWEKGCGDAYAGYSWIFGTDKTQGFSIDASISDDGTRYSLQLKNVEISFRSIHENDGIEQPSQTIAHTILPSANLGGNVYQLVQEIVVDTTNKAAMVSHLYLSKNTGLVAFKAYPSGILWVKK